MLTHPKCSWSRWNYGRLDKIQRKLSSSAGFYRAWMAKNLQTWIAGYYRGESTLGVLPPLDQEMAAFIQTELLNGSRITSQSVTWIWRPRKIIVPRKRSKITSDLTSFVGVGTRKNTYKAAGIELNYVAVSTSTNTTKPVKKIFLVGDAITVKQEITGQDALIFSRFSC